MPIGFSPAITAKAGLCSRRLRPTPKTKPAIWPAQVPRTGFEPARLSALPPQSSASANSATWAFLTTVSAGLYAGLIRCRAAEAEVGFEPTNNGFAIRPLSPLGYSAASFRRYRHSPRRSSRLLPVSYRATSTSRFFRAARGKSCLRVGPLYNSASTAG